MKGFKLDEKGDVVIQSGIVQTVADTDLLIQTIRQVLSTNRGEWWLNPKEGVPVRKILKKNPDYARIKDYVRSAIVQVDKSLQMTRCEITAKGRTLRISFSVSVSGSQGTVDAEMEV